MKVAFWLVGGSEKWMGGLNYFVNLIGALLKTDDKVIIPYLVLREEQCKDLPAELHDISKIVIEWPGQQSIMQRVETLARLLDREGIELLSHAPPIFESISIPTIGWIPDFQHRNMPWMFERSEIERRNESFFKIISTSTKIIVSSEDAKRDLLAFMPCESARIDVLSFRSNIYQQPIADWDLIAEAYNLSKKYYFLPNQFWKHKNHGVVIDALSYLAERSSKLKIVCTGCTEDYRHPEYFPSLKARIKQEGLDTQIKILGLLPRKHFTRIMVNAVAVLQPSLFEGWSTTVEEARALGKTLIISDIFVHQEQRPDNVYWFDPSDPIELGEILLRVWQSHKPESRQGIDRDTTKSAELAYRNFGKRFEDIALSTMRTWRLGNFN